MSIESADRIFTVREIVGMSPQEIGQFVRGVRRAQGLRQDQLAAAAGVGVRFLVEVERSLPSWYQESGQ